MKKTSAWSSERERVNGWESEREREKERERERKRERAWFPQSVTQHDGTECTECFAFGICDGVYLLSSSPACACVMDLTMTFHVCMGCECMAFPLSRFKLKWLRKTCRFSRWSGSTMKTMEWVFFLLCQTYCVLWGGKKTLSVHKNNFHKDPFICFLRWEIYFYLFWQKNLQPQAKRKQLMLLLLPAL